MESGTPIPLLAMATPATRPQAAMPIAICTASSGWRPLAVSPVAPDARLLQTLSIAPPLDGERPGLPAALVALSDDPEPAVRRAALSVAVLGLLGGFATPILLSTGQDRPIGLFSYLLVLNVGLAWVAHKRRWPLLGAAGGALLKAAQVELARVPQRFPASSLVDNAWYYLGQARYLEPVDTSVSKAERISLLQAAVSDLSHVAGTASPFAAGARYWRGKAHYGLAFVLAVGAAKDQAEVALAIADLQAVPPPSVYADNALYWLAKSFMHVEPAPVCGGGSTAPPASGWRAG